MGKRGNITGESFNVGVISQIEARQSFLGIDAKQDKHLIYQNNKTAFVRLASSITVVGEEVDLFTTSDPSGPSFTSQNELIQGNSLNTSAQNSWSSAVASPSNLTPSVPTPKSKKIIINEQLGNRNLPKSSSGDVLAKQCVLFGGVVTVSNDPKKPSFQPKYGVGEGEFNAQTNPNFSPGGFGNQNIDLSSPSAYGWGGLGSQGYRPMPGIIDANISYYNRGALAKATVNCKVYSIEQLQIFDLLYFRIGYTMLLEWGHNIYIDNNIDNGADVFNPNLVERKDFYTKPFQQFFSEGVNQNQILDAIKVQRESDSYNYDAMLGKVVNFSWKFNTDGSYDITLNLVGLGDIVESLKINTSTAGKTGAKPSDLISEEEQKARKLEAQIEAAEKAVTAAEENYQNAVEASQNITENVDELSAGIESFIEKFGKLLLGTALSSTTYKLLKEKGEYDSVLLFDDPDIDLKEWDKIELAKANEGLASLFESSSGAASELVERIKKNTITLPKINETILLQQIDKKDFTNSDKTFNDLFTQVENANGEFQNSLRDAIFKVLDAAGGIDTNDIPKKSIQFDFIRGNGTRVLYSAGTLQGALSEGAIRYNSELSTYNQRSATGTLEGGGNTGAAISPVLTSSAYSYKKIKDDLNAIYEKVKKQGQSKQKAQNNAQAALAAAQGTKRAADAQLKKLQQELAVLKERFQNFPQLAAEYRDKSTFNKQLYDWTQYIQKYGNPVTGEIREDIKLTEPQYNNIVSALKIQNPLLSDEQIRALIDQEFSEENQLKVKNPDFCKLNFKAVSHDAETGRKNYDITQYYVRLGYMLDWITHNLLIYDDSKNYTIPQIKVNHSGSSGMQITKGYPYLTIDTDVQNNVLKWFNSQISSDPKICIIPINYAKQYVGKQAQQTKDPKTKKPTGKTEVVDLAIDLNWSSLNGNNKQQPNLKNYFIDGEDDAARLMNIMVNIDFIAGTLAQNVDENGKVTLLNFLNAICANISDCLGGVNKLNTVYDGETNQLKIVDENGINITQNQTNNVVNGVKIPEVGRFRVYGVRPGTQGSFVTNVDFQVQLPPNMASMATISAQSSGNIVGENATGLSRLNVGLKDRIVPSKLDSQSIKSKNENGTANDPNVIFGGKINQMNTIVEATYENGSYDPQNIESLKSINRDVSLFIVGGKAEAKSIPSPFFIPFNLSLDMDGLSGMRNYERFSITEEILPYSYRSSDAINGGVIDFLIKGISHNISQNQWKTKIESLSVSSIRKPGK